MEEREEDALTKPPRLASYLDVVKMELSFHGAKERTISPWSRL